MKKLKLLIICLCLGLAGCNKAAPATVATTEPEIVESEPEISIDPEKRNFPAEDITNYYKDRLKETVLVPAYDNTKDDVYFDIKITSDLKQYRVYISNTTEADFEAYLSQLTTSGWDRLIDENTDATLRFNSARAEVRFYKMLDYEPEPYVVAVFSVGDKVFDSLQIMKDMVISLFGFVEDGILLDPDENGIVRSTRDIIWELEDFKDDDDHTRGEYLEKALKDFLALAAYCKLPGYLFYDPAFLETYNPAKDIAEIYLGTVTFEYLLYLYSYYEGEIVKIAFMAGPSEAFPNAFKE